MVLPFLGLVAISVSLGFVHAELGGPCIIYGNDFPVPKHPSKSPAVIAAVAAMTNAINAAFKGNTTYGVLDSSNTTFSADVYSSMEDGSLWIYHHTAAANLHDPTGVQHVDSNTVYALGSISKMITVYIFLLAAGDVSWNDPVTKYIPELAAAAKANPQATYNQIDNVIWNAVTVGSLASQLHGLGRFVEQDDWLQHAYEAGLGFPLPVPPSPTKQSGECGEDNYYNVACNRTQFFQIYTPRPPTVAPFRTATYSNSAFTILGYVLEAIVGQPLNTIFNNVLVKQHGLNATTFDVPNTTATSIIPVSVEGVDWSKWNYSSATNIAGGGYYSSTNDLRKMGKAILNSTFLRPDVTRRWFLPHSFNDDPRGAIGAPWELVKVNTDYRLSYYFTKGGDIGTYNTLLGYLPDFNVGFTILAAFSAKEVADIDVNTIGDIIMANMWPALESAAKEEANTNFAGTYTDPHTNSTIIVSTDQYPGLNMNRWNYNLTDIRAYYLSKLDFPFAVAVEGHAHYFRMIPTGLTNSYDNVTTAIGYRVMGSSRIVDNENQILNDICFNWENIDAITFGQYGLDDMVFNVGADGNATSLVVKAFGQTLFRQQTCK